MTISFEFWWWSGVLLMVALTVVNGFFLFKLWSHDRGLVERLDNPSVMYFATGGWITSQRYSGFLFSRSCSEQLAMAPALLRLARITAVLFVAMLTCLLAGFATVLLQWGQP